MRDSHRHQATLKYVHWWCQFTAVTEENNLFYRILAERQILHQGEINMHKTADHVKYKLASLEVNLQGFVGLQADTASAAAHSFATQWEMMKRSFRAQVKNCLPAFSRTREKCWPSEMSQYLQMAESPCGGEHLYPGCSQVSSSGQGVSGSQLLSLLPTPRWHYHSCQHLCSHTGRTVRNINFSVQLQGKAFVL